MASWFLHYVEHLIGKNPNRGVRLHHTPKLLPQTFMAPKIAFMWLSFYRFMDPNFKSLVNLVCHRMVMLHKGFATLFGGEDAQRGKSLLCPLYLVKWNLWWGSKKNSLLVIALCWCEVYNRNDENQDHFCINCSFFIHFWWNILKLVGAIHMRLEGFHATTYIYETLP